MASGADPSTGRAHDGSARGSMRAWEALEGARLHLEALGLLWREKRLWPLVAVPFTLSALAFGGVASIVTLRGPALHGFASGWLPEPRADVWWEWIWVGPASLALSVAGWLLFAGLALVLLVAAFLVASLVASPFLETLSQRVERHATGGVHESGGGSLGAILREGGRAALEEAKRTLFFLAVQAGIVLVGVVVPGGQAVAPIALVLATMLFLPLDHASFALDRWQVPFRSRRRWLAAEAPRLLGFGAAGFLLCGVPLLNFLAMPLFVTAGTLLALRYPPPGIEARGPKPTPAPGVGTSTSP